VFLLGLRLEAVVAKIACLKFAPADLISTETPPSAVTEILFIAGMLLTFTCLHLPAYKQVNIIVK
jgi:hypothetical protein